MMDTSQFEASLKDGGYKEIATKTIEPRPANGQHAHEFSVRGLVNVGEFIVVVDGVPRSYTAGQVFEVASGQLHSEAVGDEGTRITTGRKY